MEWELPVQLKARSLWRCLLGQNDWKLQEWTWLIPWRATPEAQKLTVLDEGLRPREPPMDSCHVQGALPILTLTGMKQSSALACESLWKQRYSKYTAMLWVLEKETETRKAEQWENSMGVVPASTHTTSCLLAWGFTFIGKHNSQLLLSKSEFKESTDYSPILRDLPEVLNARS